MTMLPLPVRARLIAASIVPRHLRSKAIDDAYTWARLHHPECFTDVPQEQVAVPTKPVKPYTIDDVPTFLTTKESK